MKTLFCLNAISWSAIILSCVIGFLYIRDTFQRTATVRERARPSDLCKTNYYVILMDFFEETLIFTDIELMQMLHVNSENDHY